MSFQCWAASSELFFAMLKKHIRPFKCCIWYPCWHGTTTKGTAYFPIIIKLDLEHLPKSAEAATVSKLPDQWVTSPIKAGEAVAIKKHHKNNALQEHRLGLFFWGKGFQCCFLAWLCFKGSSVALWWRVHAFPSCIHNELGCPQPPTLACPDLCLTLLNSNLLKRCKAGENKSKLGRRRFKKKVTWIYKLNKNHICQLLFGKCIAKIINQANSIYMQILELLTAHRSLLAFSLE